MQFHETGLPGAWIIDVEAHADERGLFARTFSAEEFAERGLPTRFVQCSTSYNVKRATLRGLHYQALPHPEGKIVRCTRGSIYDVILDLRRKGGSFGAWRAYELSADNRRSLYIPPGCAHGFITLQDDAEIYYQMTDPYAPEYSRGVLWNDPEIGISWPLAPAVISANDRQLPMLADAECY